MVELRKPFPEVSIGNIITTTGKRMGRVGGERVGGPLSYWWVVNAGSFQQPVLAPPVIEQTGVLNDIKDPPFFSGGSSPVLGSFAHRQRKDTSQARDW